MIADVAVPCRDLPLDHLYEAARTPELVRVPPLDFAMVDGRGDPNTADAYREAIQALFGISWTLKFALQRELGLHHRVAPLEGLWWADDMTTFTTGAKGEWSWTAMIAQPDAVTPERFERARAELRQKRPSAAVDGLRLERFDEGLAAQVMHVGPYSAEGPTIETLHAFIAALGYGFDGRREKHHEIYLGDPRRAAPERLRTIIRQPVVADPAEA